MPPRHNNGHNRHRHHNQNRRAHNNQAAPPETLPKPYGFSSIDTRSALTDAPVSRSEAGKLDEYFTGSLDITLTTLTPLMVGAWQQKINDQQSQLWPQRLEDGRLVINASSLKGMLRAALSRLLHAPMERVAEHHYTFRPNLAARTQADKGIVCLPAVVVKPGDENTPPIVALLARVYRDRNNQNKQIYQANSVAFVKQKAAERLQRQLVELHPGMRIQGELDGLKWMNNRFKQNLDASDGQTAQLDHVLLAYAGGLDGENILNTRGQVYKWVLVRAQDYQNARRMNIPDNIWKHYRTTQDLLANDKNGHLAPGYPGNIGNDLGRLKRAIGRQKRLQENQLVYMEVRLPNLEVVSLGHHYHYRWAYTSSVHKKGEQQRPELSFLPNERPADQSGRPQALAANRLLFGYSDKELGKGDWQRMAGRITPNHAVEHLPENQDAKCNERFLDEGKGVMLKPLGKPRPSAVEFYLKQKVSPKPRPGVGLKTYGETPLDKGGDLAGRKYYHHHQIQAKENKTLYEQAGDDATLGTRVHCLSTPDTRFRFRLHFEQLRLWELGALLAVVEPQRLAALQGCTDDKLYAHKLGYGKPLGLGSVQLTIDRWRCLGEGLQWRKGDETLCRQALEALQQKMQETGAWKSVSSWLDTLDFDRFSRCDYPRVNGEIYKFHTDIRRSHMALRRGDERIQQPAWGILVDILNRED